MNSPTIKISESPNSSSMAIPTTTSFPTIHFEEPIISGSLPKSMNNSDTHHQHNNNTPNNNSNANTNKNANGNLEVPLAPTAVNPPRRGHRHRRSAAISGDFDLAGMGLLPPPNTASHSLSKSVPTESSYIYSIPLSNSGSLNNGSTNNNNDGNTLLPPLNNNQNSTTTTAAATATNSFSIPKLSYDSFSSPKVDRLDNDNTSNSMHNNRFFSSSSYLGSPMRRNLPLASSNSNNPIVSSSYNGNTSTTLTNNNNNINENNYEKIHLMSPVSTSSTKYFMTEEAKFDRNSSVPNAVIDLDDIFNKPCTTNFPNNSSSSLNSNNLLNLKNSRSSSFHEFDNNLFPMSLSSPINNTNNNNNNNNNTNNNYTSSSSSSTSQLPLSNFMNPNFSYNSLNGNNNGSINNNSNGNGAIKHSLFCSPKKNDVAIVEEIEEEELYTDESYGRFNNNQNHNGSTYKTYSSNRYNRSPIRNSIDEELVITNNNLNIDELNNKSSNSLNSVNMFTSSSSSSPQLAPSSTNTLTNNAISSNPNINSSNNTNTNTQFSSSMASPAVTANTGITTNANSSTKSVK
ncbi:unnamed protein product [[Candida] boidinii]|nr:unnamed protein product [[Candida] boidinii]